EPVRSDRVAHRQRLVVERGRQDDLVAVLVVEDLAASALAVARPRQHLGRWRDDALLEDPRLEHSDVSRVAQLGRLLAGAVEAERLGDRRRAVVIAVKILVVRALPRLDVDESVSHLFHLLVSSTGVPAAWADRCPCAPVLGPSTRQAPCPSRGYSAASCSWSCAP